MTPVEALVHLTNGDPDGIVPPLYRHMSEGLLLALVDEIGAAAAAPVTPGRPRRARVNPTCVSPAPVSPAPPNIAPPGLAASPVQTLLRHAITRPGRLRTPARRRVAFLQHYASCRTLVEAAARSGIDRRTVNRWRTASPAFDRRLAGFVADRRQDAFEQALLVASRPTVRPVFYRGEKVGEYEVPNTALALYLLKQADLEAQRAESRRSPKAQPAAKPKSFGDALEEALRRADEKRLRDAEEDAERRPGEMSRSAQEEMSRTPGEEMSRSPGHSGLPANEQSAMAWTTEARRQHWAEIERRVLDSTESAQSEE